MGWGYSGVNPDTGDEMGYSVAGTCSHAGCSKDIDHGLSFVCGGMHQGGERGCGRYYCYSHLVLVGTPASTQLCAKCADQHARQEHT